LSAGSTFSHGDQACQFWKSFTCANAAGAGARRVALRSTLKSAGCSATTIRKITTTAANAARLHFSILFP
jgi:hypothetical protein